VIRIMALVPWLLVAAAPIAGAAELQGTVLLPDGLPAAGAQVSAAGVFVKPSLRLSAVTNAAGQFRLELKPLVGAQRWSVCARLDRQGGEANDSHGIVNVVEGQDLTPVVIRLTQRGIIRGRVLQAEDEKPIPGARLFLDSGEVLTTDSEGSFAAGGLPLKNHSLIAVAPGRARPYVLFDNSLRPDAELEIRLERGGTLVGRVLDEQGQPIPGAYLTRASSGTALTLNGWDELCQADGSFRYDGLTLNRLFYNLQAAAPGYQPAEHTYPLVRPGEPTEEFSFKLKQAAPVQSAKAASQDRPTAKSAALPRRDLTGTVITGGDLPVANAIVRWGATMYEETQREVSTDVKGQFHLLDVPDRDGYVTVIAKGFAPQFVRVAAGARETAVRLDEGERVQGVVRSSSGKPINGVSVVPVLTSPDASLCNPLWLTERQTQTDAQGRFEISGLPRSGARYDILHPAYSELRNVTLKHGGEDNEVALQAGGAIRGQVVDPAGKPARNFRIRVQIPRDLKPGEKAGGYYAGYDWYGVSFTSPDGTFVLSDVPAGAWLRLHAIAPGFGQAVCDRVQAAPLDELPPADQLLLKLQPAHSLHIKVVTEFLEKPISGALVTLCDDYPQLDQRVRWGYDDLWGTRGWTDVDGTAAFSELEFGEATVLVDHPDYARVRFGWRSGEQELRITLAPEAKIQGIVKLGSDPLEDFHVRLTSEAHDSFPAQHADGGRFSIDRLPAGQFTLEILDERRSLHKETVELKAGESRAVDLKLDPEKLKPGTPQ